MTESIEELDIANRLLDAALERYLNACTVVQSRYAEATASSDTARMLANRVIRELTSASSFEIKIKQAKSIIRQTRNFSSASIHALPSELLARIFLLTAGDSCDIKVGSSKSRYIPRHPDFLSHVCSRWRSIAVEFSPLWTHIDLARCHSSHQTYVERAEVFASRAGQLPLDVHIQEPTSPDSNVEIDALYDFLSSITERTQSLELTTAESSSLDEELFECVFETLESSPLSRFSVKNPPQYTPVNVRAFEDGDEGEYWDERMLPIFMCHYLNLPSKVFEGVLRSVRVLNLSGVYPHWASQAYQGLVELRLYRSGGKDFGITAGQIHGVLGSSPSLVVLLFELNIVGDPAKHVIAPIHLEELETLDCNILKRGASSQLDVFLALFTPGPKLQQLSMYLPDKPPFLDSNCIVTKLLKNSNVTKLRLHGLEGAIVVDDLLGLVPRVRVLALSGVGGWPPVGPFTSTSQHGNRLVDLDALYLERGRFDLDSLRLLAKTCLPKAIIVWKTEVCRDRKLLNFEEECPEIDSDVDFEVVTNAQVRAALSEFCPLVKRERSGLRSPSRDREFRNVQD